MENQKFCPKCGLPLSKSPNDEYAYQCLECDEDFYAFEVLDSAPTEQQTQTHGEDKEIQRTIISRSILADNGYNDETLSDQDLETIADALIDYWVVSDGFDDALESTLRDYGIEKNEE
jgi:hypothetical protein